MCELQTVGTRSLANLTHRSFSQPQGKAYRSVGGKDKKTERRRSTQGSQIRPHITEQPLFQQAVGDEIAVIGKKVAFAALCKPIATYSDYATTISITKSQHALALGPSSSVDTDAWKMRQQRRNISTLASLEVPKLNIRQTCSKTLPGSICSTRIPSDMPMHSPFLLVLPLVRKEET